MGGERRGTGVAAVVGGGGGVKEEGVVDGVLLRFLTRGAGVVDWRWVGGASGQRWARKVAQADVAKAEDSSPY